MTNEDVKILSKKKYEKELLRLQLELIKLQDWIRQNNKRVVIIFEGRDAAGKGGAIKRISDPLNPRFCKVIALGTPTEKEKSQWYFQRYVEHLPPAGEITIFDRSWYNRAGVEKVMNFCSDKQYEEFLVACPIFEKLLVDDGINLIKYWFSVSDTEQEKRFQERLNNPLKNWKLSPMDIESRDKWIDYSKAKDYMFEYTDLQSTPWWVVDGDLKKNARLNCIEHLLSKFDYSSVSKTQVKLPKRKNSDTYIRPSIAKQNFVPKVW